MNNNNTALIIPAISVCAGSLLPKKGRKNPVDAFGLCCEVIKVQKIYVQTISFELHLQISDIEKSFVKLLLVWTTAAQPEYDVSCGMHHPCSDFQQFDTDRIDTVSAHALR